MTGLSACVEEAGLLRSRRVIRRRGCAVGPRTGGREPLHVMKRVLPYMLIFLVVAAVYLAGSLESAARGLSDLKFRLISSQADRVAAMSYGLALR